MAGMVISTIEEFQEYLGGVAARSDHHAKTISGVILSLAGAVVLFKDPGSEIRVMAREGQKGNMMWVHIGGRRYALSYDHPNQSVQVKDGGTKGEAVETFDNDSTVSDIIQFFNGLRQAVIV